MQSNWRPCALGDVITLKRGYDLPAKERRPGNVPIVSSSGFSDTHADAKVRGPGVVTGRYGTIGSVFYVEQDFWPLNTTLYVQDFKGNDPRFVSYLLRTVDFQQFSDKAAVPGVNRNHLHTVATLLPPLYEQRQIASVLKAFDDRIDLLRQTNATLESIAQALFKSWFIDFDPVRAKAEGREPEGMDAATAALFPAEFEEATLGLIPRGWTPREIDELADRVGMGPFGSNIKVSTFVAAGVPVLTGACLKGALLEDDEYRFITVDHAKRLSGSLVGPGDIVITHRGTLGQVSMIPAGTSFETYVLSQSQFFLRANANLTTPEFLTYFLRSPVGQRLLLANASQVGVPSISRPVTYLKSLRLAAPAVAVARAFSSLITPLHQRTVAGRTQIASLVALRDSLLPRLISGKLRLPEAQEELEDALA